MGATSPLLEETAAEDVNFRRRLSTSALLRQNDHLETLVQGDEETQTFRPSDLLPELTEEQRIFFYLIRDEDVEAATRFLGERPGFDINCLNHQGTTALQEAVQRSCADMVTLLMSQPQVKLLDCVLHAVATGDVEITGQLLDRWKQQQPDREYNGYLDSPSYTPDTTPLILASQLDDYCMVQMLLGRGHLIQPPHPPSCFCREVCFRKLNGEDLARSLKRLNAYQALASPAYISHTSSDPIYTCFTLAEELDACAEAEAEFRTAYSQLSEQVSEFAVQLLEYCRTTTEVQSIAQRPHGCQRGAQPFPYPRILMAVDLNQKKFVTHPKVQQVFTNLWLGRRQSWKHHSSTRQVLTFFIHLLLFPMLGLLSIVAPCCMLDKYWTAPISKYINWVASYVVFLALIILSSMLDDIGQVRGPPDLGMEVFIVVWVAGLTYAHWRQLWQKGFRRFMRSGWHWFDSIMLTAFYLAFLCRAVASYDVRHYDNVHLGRRYWHQYDPTLVEESFIAIANILAFTKMLYLCQMSSTLGPLEISLGKMLQNVGDFLLVFAAVVIAFALGMNRLFDYYKGMVRRLGNGDENVQMHSFVNLRSAFRTLFWTLFGMYDLEAVTVFIENLPGGNKDHPIINEHTFTEAVGYLLFGSYHVLCVMIIMNMLIAMMTCTFHEVNQSADCEWKFARTKVWITYILEPAMPPPFNLVPSLRSVWYMLTWLGLRMSRNGAQKVGCNPLRCCYTREPETPVDDHSYHVLISALVQRYFRHRAETEAEESVTSSEVLGLANSVRNLNTEIKDRARNRQKTPEQRIAYASEVSLLSF